MYFLRQFMAFPSTPLHIDTADIHKQKKVADI